MLCSCTIILVVSNLKTGSIHNNLCYGCYVYIRSLHNRTPLNPNKSTVYHTHVSIAPLGSTVNSVCTDVDRWPSAKHYLKSFKNYNKKNLKFPTAMERHNEHVLQTHPHIIQNTHTKKQKVGTKNNNWKSKQENSLLNTTSSQSDKTTHRFWNNEHSDTNLHICFKSNTVLL